MAQSSVKKFHIFRQNVNVIGGGLVLHANRLLEPNFKQSYQSNQHESILVELILPDLIRNESENKVDKPKFVLGMAREDANGHEFYKYLLSVIEKLKGTLSKLQRLKGTRNDFVLVHSSWLWFFADCSIQLKGSGKISVEHYRSLWSRHSSFVSKARLHHLQIWQNLQVRYNWNWFQNCCVKISNPVWIL